MNIRKLSLLFLLFEFLIHKESFTQELRGIPKVEWPETTRSLLIEASNREFGISNKTNDFKIFYRIDSQVVRLDDYHYKIINSNINLLTLNSKRPEYAFTSEEIKNIMLSLFPSLLVDINNKNVELFNKDTLFTDLFDYLLKSNLVTRNQIMDIDKKTKDDIINYLQVKMSSLFENWIFKWIGHSFTIDNIDLSLGKANIDGLEKIKIPVINKEMVESWSWLQHYVYFWEKSNLDSDCSEQIKRDLDNIYNVSSDDISCITFNESFMNKAFYDNMTINECSYMRQFIISSYVPYTAISLLSEIFKIQYP